MRTLYLDCGMGAAGDMLTAAALLGEPYFLSGRTELIAEGECVFRMPDRKLLPANGSYRVQLCGDGTLLNAVAEIGLEKIRVFSEPGTEHAVTVRLKILEKLK